MLSFKRLNYAAKIVWTSDVNNTEIFDADSILLVIDAESTLLFSEKNEPGRGETLAKRARAEPIL